MRGWLHTYCFLQSILFGIARTSHSAGSDRASCGLNGTARKSVFLLQAHTFESNTSALGDKSVIPAQKWNREYVALSISALVLWGLVLYVKISIDEYLEASTPTSPPWFCDGRLVMRFCGVGVVGWYLIAVLVFTQIMSFGEDRQHLTVIEAIYLSSQILTTVGYGDFTPATPAGYGFLAFYTLVGVTFFGLLFAEMFSYEFGTRKQQPLSADTVGAAIARVGSAQQVRHHHHKGRYDDFIHALWPCVLAAVVGTFFFHYYPGEQKPFWEALYTSVVSLTSVGFGAFHPVTQAGYLFTSVWLLLGVSATANMIVTLGNSFLKYRKEVRAEHMSLEMLAQMDISHTGKVDKMEFLRFELVRRGLCGTDDIDDILDLFADLDTSNAGELETVHLETLVRPESTPLFRAMSLKSSMSVASLRGRDDD